MLTVGVRAGVVLIVIVAHIALLFLLSQRQRRETSDARSMQLVFIPQRDVSVAPRVPSIPLHPKQTSPRRIENPFAAVPSNDSQLSKPPVDWHASGNAAASDAVAEQLRKESYRNFGAPKRDPVEVSAPSVFEEPKHKAGDIENDQANGIARVYHSEHCFTQLDYPTLKDPGEELKSKINLPRCMYDVGKKAADGDLFEHLKKEQPLPGLKVGTKPDPLPERIDPPKSP